MSQAEMTTQRSSQPLVGVLVVYLGLFLFAYTVPLANPAKEPIAEALHLANEAATWPLFTCYFLAWLFVVPPSSYLADRFGRKPMLLIGSAALTAGMLLFSSATNLTTACIAQFLNGAGAIVLQIVGVAIITDLNAQRRGSNLSLAVGLVGMVALFSPMLMGELLQQDIAWQDVYRFSALLPACAFGLQLFCAFPAAATAERITLRIVRELLSSPAFLMLIFAMLVYAIVEQGIPIWSASYLGEELNASPRWQGFVVSGYFLVMSLMRSLVGMFGLLDRVSYAATVIASAVLGGICVALGTLPNNLTLAIIFLIASGPAIAMIWPSIMTYAVESTGKPTTTVFGLVVGLGGSLGAVLGASVLGAIKQQGLSYQQSLLALEIPLVALLAIFGCLLLAGRGKQLRPASTTATAPTPVEAESAPL